MKKALICTLLFVFCSCKTQQTPNQSGLSWIIKAETVYYGYGYNSYVLSELIEKEVKKGNFTGIDNFLRENERSRVYPDTLGKYPNPYIRLYKSQIYYHKYLQTNKTYDSLLQQAVDTLGIATISSFRRFYSVGVKRDSVRKPYFDKDISLKVFEDTVMLSHYLLKLDSGKAYLRAYDKMRLDITKRYIFPKIYAECKRKNIALSKCLVLEKLLNSFAKSPYYKVDKDLITLDSCKNSEKAFYYNPTFNYDIEKMRIVCID